MWHLRVQDCPAIVTMDTNGNCLHNDIEQASGKELAQLALSS
jgi:fumarate hydratase class I